MNLLGICLAAVMLAGCARGADFDADGGAAPYALSRRRRRLKLRPLSPPPRIIRRLTPHVFCDGTMESFLIVGERGRVTPTEDGKSLNLRAGTRHRLRGDRPAGAAGWLPGAGWRALRRALHLVSGGCRRPGWLDRRGRRWAVFRRALAAGVGAVRMGAGDLIGRPYIGSARGATQGSPLQGLTGIAKPARK